MLIARELNELLLIPAKIKYKTYCSFDINPYHIQVWFSHCKIEGSVRLVKYGDNLFDFWFEKIFYWTNQSLLNVCTNHHDIFSQQTTVKYQKILSTCLVLSPYTHDQFTHNKEVCVPGVLDQQERQWNHGACQEKL